MQVVIHRGKGTEVLTPKPETFAVLTDTGKHLVFLRASCAELKPASAKRPPRLETMPVEVHLTEDEVERAWIALQRIRTNGGN